MAAFRDDPYRALDSRVSIEGADADGSLAGSCEVAGLSTQAETVAWRAAVAMTRKLTGCPSLRYVGPEPRADATEVAVEELALSVELLDVE